MVAAVDLGPGDWDLALNGLFDHFGAGRSISDTGNEELLQLAG